MSEQTSSGDADKAKQLVVLGTGGTIAGTANSASDHTGYTAAQISVETLLQNVPGLQAKLQGHPLVSEQVAQLDSKDMDFATMLLLAQRCCHFLAQPQTRGIVITHGTDTLEETAYFLHRVIPAELQSKPIVITCAMRPATSSEADGPRNLCDAITLASEPQAHGVLVVCAGDVHHAVGVQKIHTYALNAFSSGDAALGELGLLARVVNADVQWYDQAERIVDQYRPIAVVESALNAIECIAKRLSASTDWPRVEIVLNHTHTSGSIVRSLLSSSVADDPLRGIVVAGTGNGSVSESLECALDDAQSQGVEVVIASRCTWGGIHGGSALSATKARVDLVLRLLQK